MVEPTIRISEIFGPTIQGEGTLIGQPTVFVRTGGCDYRCSWCDTLHAVNSEFRHTWLPMTAAEIFVKVQELSGGIPLMVSLSGGNPAIQPLGELIALGKAHGYRFALETQGSIAKDWFANLDVLTLSPKPPSSNMITDWAAFDACIQAALASLACHPRLVPGSGVEAAVLNQDKTTLPSRQIPGQARDDTGPKIALKIVVFDEVDYKYAKDTAARYPQLPVYLQPGNHTPPPPDKADSAIDLAGIMERMRWLVDKVVADRWFNATVLPQLHVLLWGNLRGV